MIKVDCATYAQEILDSVKEWGWTHRLGKLYILYGGDDPASASYMRGKLKDAAYCGIPAEQIKCRSMYEMRSHVMEIYEKWVDFHSSVAGIIIQLPLPEGWYLPLITDELPSSMDVDGLLPDSPYKPCTPAGILHIMHKELGDDLSGKDVLLIGKGKLVGKPLIPMLLDAGCTLTVAHSRTKGLSTLLLNSHCIISGVGKPNLIDPEDFWQVPLLVIDAGISRDEDGRLCGDVDWRECPPEYAGAGKYTSVPGGVGLMTRAMLMKNVALASGMREEDFK